MALIVNRDMDVSEKRIILNANFGALATGTSAPIGIVPFPAQVKGIFEGALGLSGSPTHQVVIHRFIPGAGQTVITGLANALALTAFGTSGLQSASLVGSSILLQAGDILSLSTGGANSAANASTVQVVIEALQDQIQWQTVSNS